MFRLRFSPQFAQQQREFLALDSTPPLDLSGPIEQALSALEGASRTVETTVETTPETPSTTQELWRACFKAGRPLFIKASLASCFSSFCVTGSTLVAMKLLDSDQGFLNLCWFALVYFILNSFSQFGNFITNQLRAELSLASETKLVALISRKILRLSFGSRLTQSSGNLKVLITSDVKNIGEFLNNLIRNLVPSVVSVVVMAPFLIHFSGRAGWVGLLTMGMIIPIAIWLNYFSIRFQTLTQARMDELTSVTTEWIKNIRLVRFLSWDSAIEIRIEAQLKRFMKVAVLHHVMACLIFGFSTTWWMITGASVLLFAKLFHYPLELRGYFGSLWLLTFIAGYFTHLPNAIRMLGMAIPSMKRISTLLQASEQRDAFEAPAKTSRLLSDKKPTKVIFDQVGFSFGDSNESASFKIKNLCTEIRLHQKTAILGEVGSGKTTFLKLLCGEFPPTSGKIWIEFDDGSKASLWEEDIHTRFREALALVPQIPYVSSDLLSVNISLSTENTNEHELLNALQRAEMRDDIDQFSGGIHQMIGESGVNLSGGQRQRLNLARAFHSNRPYLVLDDTLSAVDQKTEVALMEQICLEEKGVLLVTHRLSEINRLGYVLVFQDGSLIEEGNPESLSKLPHSAFMRAIGAYSHE